MLFIFSYVVFSFKEFLLSGHIHQKVFVDQMSLPVSHTRLTAVCPGLPGTYRAHLVICVSEIGVADVLCTPSYRPPGVPREFMRTPGQIMSLTSRLAFVRWYSAFHFVWMKLMLGLFVCSERMSRLGIYVAESEGTNPDFPQMTIKLRVCPVLQNSLYPKLLNWLVVEWLRIKGGRFVEPQWQLRCLVKLGPDLQNILHSILSLS